MEITQIKQKIQKLLKRILILKPETSDLIKSQIDFIEKPQLERILKILIYVDAKQTETMQEILKDEPYFFYKLENIILTTMSEEFEKEEEIEHNEADQKLINDINALNQ